MTWVLHKLIEYGQRLFRISFKPVTTEQAVVVDEPEGISDSHTQDLIRRIDLPNVRLTEIQVVESYPLHPDRSDWLVRFQEKPSRK